ncbi:MAG: hypothetical protein J0H49_16550, partial [Acidobacteria bacterium]|nr:hypothetical protein [Acidobacteriota bacterium]
EPCRANGRVPSSHASRHNTRPRMMSASGAMMSLPPAGFRKLRFQMIADINLQSVCICVHPWPNQSDPQASTSSHQVERKI